MLEAIIITIPKPGKDTTSPANYRPISLLNSNIKIYAKILASSLLEITPYLIRLDQVGFVKGRQAPDGTRRMINLIQQVENSGVPSLLLALDAEKAFDRVYWGYLSATLMKFRFTGFIHLAIMSLYTKPSAKVFTSGNLSKSFDLSIGTRQGCPLSPIIFSLEIEPLAELIRSNESITGIKVGNIEHKLGLFTDDILSLSNLETSLTNVQNILESLGKISYYKINSNKCHVLPMNISQKSYMILKNKTTYNWDQPSIPYLGIQLTYPTAKLDEVNFPKLLENINKDLQSFHKTQLSWVGKIAAFKMQTLPKILYYFRLLPIQVNNTFFNQVNLKLKKCIWNDKKPRVAFSILTTTKNKCGMGPPDIRQYYYASLLDQMKFWFSN